MTTTGILLAVWVCLVYPAGFSAVDAFSVPRPALLLRKVSMPVCPSTARPLIDMLGRRPKQRGSDGQRTCLFSMQEEGGDKQGSEDDAIQKGDSLLAAAATALAEGDLSTSRDNLREARAAYKEADVSSRDGLILEIEDRLATASSSAKSKSPPGSPRSSQTLTLTSQIQQRYRLAKQVGDDFLQESAKALGEKQYMRARELVDMARSSFADAGDTISREREPLLQNMLQYIVVEEEREVLSQKRRAKELKEREEEQLLAKRMEQALGGVMEEEEEEEDLKLVLDSTINDASSLADSKADDNNAAIAAPPTTPDKPDLVVLVDNGSSRPQSTLMLRDIAQKLSQRIGTDVVPVSMNHADRAKEEDLNGEPANLFKPLVSARIADGARSVVVLPLFLGPVKAVTETIPGVLESCGQDAEWFRFAVGRTLAQDSALATLLEDEVLRAVEENDLNLPSIIVVDHGSPNPEVTAVRDRLAKEVRGLLSKRDVTGAVSAASMERKEGDEFAFADPLLADCVTQVGGGEGDVVLSMLFMLPGTHAGEGGDVDEICRRALQKAGGPQRNVVKTRLLGECEGLLDVLEGSYELAMARLPRRF